MPQNLAKLQRSGTINLTTTTDSIYSLVDYLQLCTLLSDRSLRQQAQHTKHRVSEANLVYAAKPRKAAAQRHNQPHHYNGQHLFSRGLLTTMHVTVRQKPATAGATHQAPGERSEPGVYRKLSQSCSAAAQSTNTTSKHEQYREGHRHTLITGIK